MLLLRDTDQHPDVIAQRKLIESLKNSPQQGNAPAAPAAATGKDGAAARNGAANGVKRSVPNQVYDQLKVKLIEADTNVISLQRQRDDAVRYRERLEKVQREQPGLIAEYQNMDRDYTVLRRNYEELLGRLQSANIAQAADTQADKVKLQIIDPPEIPRLPVAPNRMLLVSGVLLGGLATGAGLTILFGQLDRSFSHRGRPAKSRSAGTGRHFGAGSDPVPATVADGDAISVRRSPCWSVSMEGSWCTSCGRRR